MPKWTEIAQTVADLVYAASPYINAAAANVAPAIAITEKILHGVVAAEPIATSLYNRIMGGEIPTQTELQKFSADYEAAYEKLKADIAKKLAAMPLDER